MNLTRLCSCCLLALLLLSIPNRGWAQELVPLPPGPNTSIRGLSVVNDSVAWVSGSQGWVGHTSDRGENWQWRQVPGYETFDFRDMEGFSGQRAVMVSAGSPAVVLLTTDGGRSWRETYRNEDPAIFLDGMDFWDDHRGLLYGDPINGRMQLLQTKDGGESWQDISGRVKVPLQPGEASFAASGTGIRTGQGGRAWIATGGTVSRIFRTRNHGRTWKSFPCPVIQGKPSTGPFSLAFLDARTGVAAGGDYTTDTLRTANFVLTYDGGKTWLPPTVAPWGFRSAVEYLGPRTLLATGTSGTDLSTDGGLTWRPLSPEGFHAARRAKRGSWVLLAGSKGRIAWYKE